MKSLLHSHAALPSLPALSLAENTSIVPQVGENVLGATIFFAYILSALYLTGYLVLNLVRRISPSHVPLHQVENLKGQSGKSQPRAETDKGRVDPQIARQDAKRKRWAKYFASLALVSFTLLSYNMLAFLVVSYLKWTDQYVHIGLIDLSSMQAGEHFLNIWKWATNSNLFRTFAEDLINDPETWLVVQLALLYSYTWNMWMSTIGYEREIRHLGAYFLLDQILPVSFAQTLFCATAMLERIQSQPLRASRFLSRLKLAITFLYVVVLSSISATVGTSWFFPAVFCLRAVLFAPYFLDREAFYTSSKEDSGARRRIRGTNMWCMLVLTGYSLYLVLRAHSVSGRDNKLVEINYAAAALRHDYIVGIIGSVSFFVAVR